MNILIWILTFIHVLVAAALVILVLMQKSSDQGVGAAFGGQMTETMFGGSITPLVKMTIWCACILLATTLTLAVLHSRTSGEGKSTSILKNITGQQPGATGAPGTGGGPAGTKPEQKPGAVPLTAPLPGPAPTPSSTPAPVPAPAK
jgi:preprotein translocase subunit SecG